MKKILISGLLVLVTTNLVLAQDEQLVAFNKSTEVKKSAAIANPANNSLQPNEVNPKVLKHFSRTCKKASNIRWYSVNDVGVSGYYDMPNQTGRCLYDKKGRLLYNILTYSEDFLDATTRNLVKSSYPGFGIDLVQEVFSDGITIYIVHVSDRKSIKLLTVYEGEISVYKDFDKSN